MKKKVIICAFLLMKTLTNAQGIKFEEGLTWKQIKEKAKAEHKAIFLDCFATWCEPCRAMEKDVFTAQKVADYYNSTFICVRVQMDKTSLDDPLVKSWYNDATQIHRDYTINAYPSFLYFSSVAEPLHKAVGFKDIESFINQGKDVFNPDKQFYAILKNFQPGKLDIAEMKGLARAYEFNKDLSGKIALDYLTRIPRSEVGSSDNLSFMELFLDAPGVLDIAKVYINSFNKQSFTQKKNIEFLGTLNSQDFAKAKVAAYLNHLPNQELRKNGNMQLMMSFKTAPKVHDLAKKYISNFSKEKKYSFETINFTTTFTEKASDKSFDLFFKHPQMVDKIVKQKGYASRVVDFIIIKNDINPLVSTTKEGEIPKFDSIYQVVKTKFGIAYADRTILKAKLAFYKYRAKKYNTDWETYLNLAIKHEKKYGMDTISFWGRRNLNDLAYNDVFFHSSNIEQLNSAIGWMKAVVNNKEGKEYTSSDYGYIDTYANLLYKAGRNDEALQYELKAIEGSPKDKEIKEAYEKMLAGEPTWLKP